MDALHFPKLVDRVWQNLRRCAGYEVQYFATIEAQRRLAPQLHAAMRGTIPRWIIRQVRATTYHQVWWPAHDTPVYVDRLPAWSETAGYVDPDTGVALPTWDEALDALDADPDAEPRHALRFGEQDDLQGPLGRLLRSILNTAVDGAVCQQDSANAPYRRVIDAPLVVEQGPRSAGTAEGETGEARQIDGSRVEWFGRVGEPNGIRGWVADPSIRG